jgi:hypothetical protein
MRVILFKAKLKEKARSSLEMETGMSVNGKMTRCTAQEFTTISKTKLSAKVNGKMEKEPSG